MSNPLKKLAGQTAIYGLGTILPRFLNYFLTPVLTYAFAVAEYGINGELFAYISFLNIIFTYGMETTFFNFYTKNENKQEVYNTALLMLLGSSAILGLILILLAPSIAENLSTPSVTYLPQFITWCALIIVSDAIMAIPFAKLRSDNQPLKFSILKIANVLINAGLTVFFVMICKPAFENGETTFFATLYNPEIGIGYCFLSMLIANVVTLLFIGKQFAELKLKINKELLNQMLKYTWPLIILGLAGMVNETLDRIILKKLMVDKDAAQVAQGIYSACYKIAILMTIFIQAFRFAAEPFFFNQAADKNSKKVIALVMKYFVIFCSFLFLGTMMNMQWISYLIDEEYRAGLKVVPILLMANLCLGVVYNLSIWYKLSGRTGFGATIAIIGAVVTIVINVIFVPQFSYVACAWATLAAYGIMMIVSYILGQKHYPIKYNVRAMMVFVAIALGFYALSFSYQSIDNVILKLALNNLLVLLFAWLFYKLEFSNLKEHQKPIAIMITIKVVNQSNHPLPEYATDHSAGLDLRANLNLPIVLKPLERVLVPTGLFIELPQGHEAQIRPRSGLAFKNGITVLNSPGTIDADYRGEIKVLLVNLSNENFTINDGERIAQMVIARHETIEWYGVMELDETKRGAGGFGSTGKK